MTSPLVDQFIPIHPLEDEWVKIDPHSSPFICYALPWAKIQVEVHMLTFVSISAKHCFLNLSKRPRFFSLSTISLTTLGSTWGIGSIINSATIGFQDENQENLEEKTQHWKLKAADIFVVNKTFTHIMRFMIFHTNQCPVLCAIYPFIGGKKWSPLVQGARVSTITYGDRAHARETPYVIVRVSTVTLCGTEHALCITRACSISQIVTEG